MIPTPGALTSGLSCSETGVGPADEKLGDHVTRRHRRDRDRDGALPGELIEP